MVLGSCPSRWGNHIKERSCARNASVRQLEVRAEHCQAGHPIQDTVARMSYLIPQRVSSSRPFPGPSRFPKFSKASGKRNENWCYRQNNTSPWYHKKRQGEERRLSDSSQDLNEDHFSISNCSQAKQNVERKSNVAVYNGTLKIWLNSAPVVEDSVDGRHSVHSRVLPPDRSNVTSYLNIAETRYENSRYTNIDSTPLHPRKRYREESNLRYPTRNPNEDRSSSTRYLQTLTDVEAKPSAVVFNDMSIPIGIESDEDGIPDSLEDYIELDRYDISSPVDNNEFNDIYDEPEPFIDLYVDCDFDS